MPSLQSLVRPAPDPEALSCFCLRRPSLHCSLLQGLMPSGPRKGLRNVRAGPPVLLPFLEPVPPPNILQAMYLRPFSCCHGRLWLQASSPPTEWRPLDEPCRCFLSASPPACDPIRRLPLFPSRSHCPLPPTVQPLPNIIHTFPLASALQPVVHPQYASFCRRGLLHHFARPLP